MKKIYRARPKKKNIPLQTKNTLALPERANSVSTNLRSIKTVFLKIFSDENFLTLLKAESMTTIPAYLRPVLDEAKTRHDIA